MTITDGLKPYFKLAAFLGAASMVFDTWLSGKFGYSISLDMAGIFGLVSLASGVLLVIAAAFWRSGHASIARGIAAAWVPIFAFNVMSNMGVATANRMSDVQQATVQQTKFDAAQDSAKENAANLKMWNARLAELTKDNPWLVSVSADALRAKLPALNLAIEQESRRGGCGPKCLERTKERDAVAAQIASAEEKDRLTKQIEATQKLVDKYRAKLADTEAGVSQAANQSHFFAKLMSFRLYASPDDKDIGVANEGMGMFTALVLALVSALLTYVGAYPHLQEIRPSQATTGFVRGKAPTEPAPHPATHTINTLSGYVSHILPGGQQVAQKVVTA